MTQRILVLGCLVIVAVVGTYFLRDHLSFEVLSQHHEALTSYRDQNFVSLLLAFIALYFAVVAFSLPGAVPLSLAGGFLFGIVGGTLANVTAATLGACAIFLAVRYGLGQAISAKLDTASGTVLRVKQGLDENQWSMLFIMRLVPIVPFFVANIIPALLNVRLSRFAVSTFFGIIPGGIVFSSIGAGLGDVLAAGQSPDLSVIWQPHILGPILGLAALSALPILMKKFKGAA